MNRIHVNRFFTFPKERFYILKIDDTVNKRDFIISVRGGMRIDQDIYTVPREGVRQLGNLESKRKGSEI